MQHRDRGSLLCNSLTFLPRKIYKLKTINFSLDVRAYRYTHAYIDTVVQKLLYFFSSPTNLHLLLLFFSLLFALLSHLFIPCMLVLCFLLKKLGHRNWCGSPELTNRSRIMATWVGNDPCFGSYELVRDTWRRTRFLVTMV